MSGVLQMKTKSKREPVTLGMDVAVGDDYRHPPTTLQPARIYLHLCHWKYRMRLCSR